MTVTYGSLSVRLPFGGFVENERRGQSSDGALGLVGRRQMQSSVNRQTGRADARRWQFDVVDATGLEYAAVDAAFLAGAGGHLPISWTPPKPYDGAAIPVLLSVSGVRPASGQIYAFTLALQEVI